MNKYENRTPVKQVIVTLDCSVCGGEMVKTGMMKPSLPPLIEHRCNECGTVDWIRGGSYPRIEYVRDEECSNT